MKLLQDFKEFAVKGNMVDLAIGVIIGASFNKLVDTLVKNVITPPLGFLTSGVDIGDMQWVLRAPETNPAGEVVRQGVIIQYGLFLEACIDFFIVAFTIFIVVKGINALRNKAEDEKNTEIPTPKNIQLLAEIRDQMSKTNELLTKERG